MKKYIDRVLSFDDVLLAPKYSTVKSRKDVSLETEVAGLKLDIPIIAANMPSVCEFEMAGTMAYMGGLGIIHRMQNIFDQVNMAQRARSIFYCLSNDNKMDRKIEDRRNKIGAAIGVGEDWIERAKCLIDDAGVDLICIDVAHANASHVVDVYSKFRKTYPGFPLVIGNFAVRPNEKFISNLESNNHIAFKMGIGGGSICSTRIQTGCGIPTFQSLLWASEGSEINLIADGGIKNSGDVVKALAAGARAVMLGSLLAGTDESPGNIILDNNGNKFKTYFGNASFAAKKLQNKNGHIEGVESLVPYKGSVIKVINNLLDGIKSGFSYCGAANLSQLQLYSRFVEISSSGYIEGTPHGMKR